MFRSEKQGLERQRTWLKQKGTSDLYISAIAGRLDALIRPNERTYDKSSSLADTIERAKLESHGGRTLEGRCETRDSQADGDSAWRDSDQGDERETATNRKAGYVQRMGKALGPALRVKSSSSSLTTAFSHVTPRRVTQSQNNHTCHSQHNASSCQCRNHAS